MISDRTIDRARIGCAIWCGTAELGAHKALVICLGWCIAACGYDAIARVIRGTIILMRKIAHIAVANSIAAVRLILLMGQIETPKN